MIIAPSLLAADFGRLAEEVREVEAAGADWLHLDIMDGNFVPNISYGPMIVKTLRKHTGLFFDVHLMIDHPDAFLEEFKDAGADMITVHQESTMHLHRTIQRIKSMGLQAGVSLNPSTPVTTLEHIMSDLDMVLIMSVNPGFGGQKFIPDATRKIAMVREMADRLKPDLMIQVDGGITKENAAEVFAAGASVLVAGSAIFGAPDRKQAILDIRNAPEKQD